MPPVVTTAINYNLNTGLAHAGSDQYWCNEAMSHVLTDNLWRLSCAQYVNCTAAHTLEETHALVNKQFDEVLRFVKRHNFK